MRLFCTRILFGLPIFITIVLSCSRNEIDTGESEQFYRQLSELSEFFQKASNLSGLDKCATLEDSISLYTRWIDTQDVISNYSVDGEVITLTTKDGMSAEITMEEFISSEPDVELLESVISADEGINDYVFPSNAGELLSYNTSSPHSTKAVYISQPASRSILIVQPYSYVQSGMNDSGNRQSGLRYLETIKGLAYTPSITVLGTNTSFNGLLGHLDGNYFYDVLYLCSHGGISKETKTTYILFPYDYSEYVRFTSSDERNNHQEISIMIEYLKGKNKQSHEAIIGYSPKNGTYFKVSSELLKNYVADKLSDNSIVINASCYGAKNEDMKNAFLKTNSSTYIGANFAICQNDILPLSIGFLERLLKGYSVQNSWESISSKRTGIRMWTRNGEDYSFAKTFSSRNAGATKASEQTGIGCCHIDLFQPYKSDGVKMYCGLVFSEKNANPTANDGTSRMVYTELDHDITEGEDYFFSMNDLKPNGTYYWRAFMASQYSDGTYFFYADEVESFHVDEEDLFRKKLIQFYKDTDGDHWIHNDNWCSDKPLAEWYGIRPIGGSEAEFVYHIDLSDNNLRGSILFEDTPLLYRLITNNNFISSIIISKCPDFSYLEHKQVAIPVEIDISDCTEFGFCIIECGVDSKTTISDCPYFSASKQKIFQKIQSEYVEVKGCEYLDYLDVCARSFKILDCPMVTRLVLHSLYSVYSGNGFGGLVPAPWGAEDKQSILELSGLTDCLETLHFQANTDEVSLQGYKKLKELDICRSNIKCLHLDNNYLLQRIDIRDHSKIQYLSTANCRELYDFDFDPIELVELDISNCTNLDYLDVANNNLESIDVSNCTNLTVLEVANNNLKSIDVSACSKLEVLNCENNPITQIITIEDSIPSFTYDRRYEYSYYPTRWAYFKPDHTGWYYAGEPEKGYHVR